MVEWRSAWSSRGARTLMWVIGEGVQALIWAVSMVESRLHGIPLSDLRLDWRIGGKGLDERSYSTNNLLVRPGTADSTSSVRHPASSLEPLQLQGLFLDGARSTPPLPPPSRIPPPPWFRAVPNQSCSRWSARE